jgi:segregation and condensation protein B
MDESTNDIKQNHEQEALGIPPIVEAMIFASPDPVTADEICNALLLEDPSLEINGSDIAGIVVTLNKSYEESGRSFSIVHRGRGYTFITDNRYHPWLQHIQHENVSRKISQSAIETLAIIAYKQPITKPEIEQIRGVDSGYIVRTLLEKKLVIVAGRRDSPGKPLLYKTSDTFLLHFGISSVEELPKPREIDEILKDDDMAEHRQLLLELRQQLDEGNPDVKPDSPSTNEV